ncbi:hypothetical protein RBB50_003977 [Rhinocladiella similis]
MSWVGRWLLYFHDWNNSINSVIQTTTTKKLDALTSPTTNTDTDGAPFKPLRIGVLGAAEINYVSIIEPVSTHPTALITAIAARDKSRAEAQIAYYKASLPGPVKAYGSYDEVVADPDIDAVYIPLPNGLHYKWALAALEAGKHVLVEKPITSNAREARALAAAAHRTGKVALEAFHWLFHPAAHTVKAMLTSGEYGRVVSVSPTMVLPAGVLGPDDIRFKYPLGGGSSMDLTYVYSASCYFADQTPLPAPESTSTSSNGRTGSSAGFTVLEATPRINASDKLIDDGMKTIISFDGPDAGTGSSGGGSGSGRWEAKAFTTCDLYVPKLFGLIPRLWVPLPSIKIECDRAEIQFTNFPGPWLNHQIVVTPVTRDAATGKIASRGKKRKAQKCYVGGPVWEHERDEEGKVVGEEWWTTYRYQLEGFVRKIREVEEETAKSKNKVPYKPTGGGSDSNSGGYVYKGPWVSLDQSVRIMDVIDAVYEKAGLPVRGE